MFIATIIVSALLAALLLVSANGKLRRDPKQMATMRQVKFPENRVWLLAVVELAGAVGLVGGLFWWPLGVAAAIGVVAYFLGAIGAHLRQRDTAIAPVIVILLAGTAALILRAASS